MIQRGAAGEAGLEGEIGRDPIGPDCYAKRLPDRAITEGGVDVSLLSVTRLYQ